MEDLRKVEDMPNVRDAVREAICNDSIVESFRMFVDKYGKLSEASGNEKEWNNYFSTFYTSLGYSKRDAFEILNKI